MYEKVLETLAYLVPFIGLILGAILAWLVPYLRAGLEAIQKADSWSAWPKFKVGYVSMTLYPLLLIGVQLVTVEGTLDTLMKLSFVAAVLYTYGGARVGHEVVKGIISVMQGHDAALLEEL